MRETSLILVVVTALLLAAACGGDGEGSPASPTTSPAERSPVASADLCLMGGEPLAAYNVEVTARWKSKDRIVIEGSAELPGPGSVNYWICQDGEVSASLVWARQPTFENGEIQAESKLVESQAGPLFDPDARFEVVLSILGDPVQVPYFIVRVPVQGKPE
jgi:hypothetical protein